MAKIFKKICKYCKRCYGKSYFKKHLKTKKHKKNLKISWKRKEINKEIINEATLFPTDILNIIMDYKEDIEKNMEIYKIIDSVNKQLEKKIKNNSNRTYSREIVLDNKIKITTIRDILSSNINENLYINYLYKSEKSVFWVNKFSEEKTTQRLSFQYNPMVYNSNDKLMILIH